MNRAKLNCLKNSKWVLTALVGGAFLFACGAKDPIRAGEQALTQPELMNTWVGDCKKNNLLDLSAREFYQLSGDVFTFAQEFYSEENCTGAAVLVKYSGDFEVGDKVAAIQGAKQIDRHFTKVTVTPLNDQGKGVLDGVDFCGQEEWIVNTEVDLTAQSGGTLCLLTDTPFSEFDIYQIRDQKLRWGKPEGSLDRSSAATRPQALEETRLFAETDRDF